MRDIAKMVEYNTGQTTWLKYRSDRKTEVRRGCYIIAHFYWDNKKARFVIKPLYIGQSKRLKFRLESHPKMRSCQYYVSKFEAATAKKTNHNFCIIYYKYIDDCKAQEKILIKKYLPKFNITHKYA